MSMLIWDITSACNLKCIHCYNAEKYSGIRKDIGGTLTLKEALGAADKLYRGGFKEVFLIGGEPLMYPDLSALIEHLKDKEFRVMVTTNGTLLNEKMAQRLVELKIDSLIVSLDGATERTSDEIRGKGSFKKATQNLKRFAHLAQEAGVNVLTGIGFVLTKKNLSEVEYLPELGNSLGVSGVDLQFLTADGRAACNWQTVGYTADSRLYSR